MATIPKPRTRTRLGKAAGLLSTIATLVLLGWLWPQTLHGPTAYIGVNGHSMDGTYRTGDLILVRHQTSYHVGDIVAYTIPANEFGAGAHVIHRIVGGNATVGYTTQGDNKTITDPWHPRPRDVLGRSRLRVPGGGNVIQYLARPLPLGLLCGGITVLALLSASRNESKTHLASDHDPGLSAASAT